MAPAILCRGLVKRFPGRAGPVTAVDGLDLEIQVGECFGLLGPNGAGKTTTLEILEGLTRPTAGEVQVLGRRWGTNDVELRQRLGVSLQETRLQEKLTAWETATLFRSFYPRGQHPDQALAAVGLAEKTAAYVGTLSGGQRQRLALACALIGDPELLFLDEPTTGLDPLSRRQVWEIIEQFRARGRTVVLTTHAMDEAERLCDRLAIVDHGRVLVAGSPAELIARLGGHHVVEFATAAGPAPAADRLKELPGIVSVESRPPEHRLTVTAPHVALPPLLEYLRQDGVTLARLSTRQASLEDVFISLTGRRLLEEGDLPTMAD